MSDSGGIDRRDDYLFDVAKDKNQLAEIKRLTAELAVAKDLLDAGNGRWKRSLDERDALKAALEAIIEGIAGRLMPEARRDFDFGDVETIAKQAIGMKPYHSLTRLPNQPDAPLEAMNHPARCGPEAPAQDRSGRPTCSSCGVDLIAVRDGTGAHYSECPASPFYEATSPAPAAQPFVPTGAGGNARAFVCCEGVGEHAAGCANQPDAPLAAVTDLPVTFDPKRENNSLPASTMAPQRPPSWIYRLFSEDEVRRISREEIRATSPAPAAQPSPQRATPLPVETLLSAGDCGLPLEPRSARAAVSHKFGPTCPKCGKIKLPIGGVGYYCECELRSSVPASAAHVHTDACWEPDSGCDMGRNEKHVRRADQTTEGQK